MEKDNEIITEILPIEFIILFINKNKLSLPRLTEK